MNTNEKLELVVGEDRALNVKFNLGVRKYGKKWWKVEKSGGKCQIIFYVCLLESEH